MALNTEDVGALKNLNEKTEEYTQLLFDWVSPLGQHGLLEKMYNLQFEIEKTIEKLQEGANAD